MNDSSSEPIARLRVSGPSCPSPNDGIGLVGQEFFLYPGISVRLGRSPESDVVLEDPLVSREHAVIEWNGNGFLLSDQGSINGTFVNNTRLTGSQRQLRDGDEIGLSKYILVYELLREDLGQIHLAEVEEAALLPEARGPRLVVCAGPDLGQEFPLWGDIITIGRASRDATWEIRLTDRAVSRPHARLERVSEICTLTDLDSANGTFINHHLVIHPVVISTGDVITLGETSLVYCP